MPVYIWEYALSPAITESVEGAQVERHLKVAGLADELLVRVLVENLITPTWHVTNQLLWFQQYTLRNEGAGNWDVVVTYGKALQRGSTAEPFAPTGNPTYNFEIGVQTQHITQSKETIGVYGAAGNQLALSFNGAIGVNGDSVEGVDINLPTMSWSETWYFPQAFVTPAYLKQLFAVGAAPVNNAPWRNFAAGEVLFMGASGTERDTTDFEVTFHFLASPTLNNLPVGPYVTGGGQIVVPQKRGWDYLWIRYQDVVSANNLVKSPVAAVVERVYDYSDFTQLGIGS